MIKTVKVVRAIYHSKVDMTFLCVTVRSCLFPSALMRASRRIGLPVPSDQKIRTFMGPPLEVTFKQEVSEEGAAKAVKIYRDYYETKGQLEAHLYDGIKEVLEQLSKDPNKKIFITTSKNEPIALEMCQHLGITEYFEGIYGSTPAAFHKADVLQRAITENQAPKAQSVIVGELPIVLWSHNSHDKS